MIISFACSSSPRPIGGVVALYEFANALSRRGHEVHVLHLRFFGCRIDSLDDLSWFRFEPGIEHHIADSEVPEFPPADIIFGTGAPPEAGLGVHLVQGVQMLFSWLEREAFRTPALKVCIASWLVESGARFGVPPEEFNVVHMGIDHRRYRLLSGVSDRPMQVAMLYHPHPAKGWAVGLAALEAAHQRVPELRAVVFGTSRPPEPLPDWVTFLLDPEQDVLVRDVYNRSRVFVQASDYEGFGFTAVEAMACGSALVSTDNGGSRDYALDGQTALLAPPRDAAMLADNLARLLRHDDERVRLASAGQVFVQRFDWDRAGEAMEAQLDRYLADPPAFQRAAGDEPANPGDWNPLRVITGHPSEAARRRASGGSNPLNATEAAHGDD